MNHGPVSTCPQEDAAPLIWADGIGRTWLAEDNEPVGEPDTRDTAFAPTGEASFSRPNTLLQNPMLVLIGLQAEMGTHFVQNLPGPFGASEQASGSGQAMRLLRQGQRFTPLVLLLAEQQGLVCKNDR